MHDAAEAYFAPTAVHSRALGSLRQTVASEGGVVTVIGRPSSGKSLLARHFAATLAASTGRERGYEPHVIDASRINRSPLGLVRALAGSLSLKRRLAEWRLYDEIEREALRRLSEGRRVVLIVDDAEWLSAAALQTLQHLWNLVTPLGDRFLVRIALFARPRIARALAQPQLLPLRSRMSTIVPELGPVESEDLARIIEHRLAVAGASEDFFTAEAIDRVVALADGTPGSAMRLASAAMVRAFAARSRVVLPEHVDREVGAVDAGRVA